MVDVCKAEQRSRWLNSLVRQRLLPKDVRNFVMKQIKQQRAGKSRGLVEEIFKSGKTRLFKKLRDNKLVEMRLRKKRDQERNKLESMLSKSVYLRMMRRIYCWR